MKREVFTRTPNKLPHASRSAKKLASVVPRRRMGPISLRHRFPLSAATQIYKHRQIFFTLRQPAVYEMLYFQNLKRISQVLQNLESFDIFRSAVTLIFC